jgi:hypothetical protein
LHFLTKILKNTFSFYFSTISISRMVSKYISNDEKCKILTHLPNILS